MVHGKDTSGSVSSSNSERKISESKDNASNKSLEDLNSSSSMLVDTDGKEFPPSNTSFEVSDDEPLQISSNGQPDHCNDSISDSHSFNSVGEKNDNQIKKTKKPKKRNKIGQMISGVTHKSKSELFQKLFKDMAPEEVLVSDYSCALQRDILVHGRLYLSQTWLCFYANIFGWETLVTIRWADITAITKEKTAKLIPNAIQVFTETDKFFFSTFVTREHAYTALFRIWQNALLGQPMLPDDLRNICRKGRGTTSRDAAVDGIPINDEHDETGDEIMEYDDDKSIVSTTSDSLPANGNGESATDGISVFSGIGGISCGVNDIPNGKSNSDSVNSSNSNENIDGVPNVISMDNVENKKVEGSTLPVLNSDTPGIQDTSSPVSKPVTTLNKCRKNIHKTKSKHYPAYLKIPNGGGDSSTDNESEEDSVVVEPDDDVLCPCHNAHSGREYVNEEFNFDVDALYEHLFSQESDMMKSVFKQRKFENTKYTPYKRDPNGCFFQVLSYTIPLNYSIGPKQCHTVTKQIMQKENTSGSFYIVKTESTTVGIPYGDSFHVSTQYCITRASGNRSRLRITTEIIYTKRVFGLVKNMISRGTDEAFKDYINFLVNILKSESDLLSYKEVKPMKKTKLLKSKSNESGKSIPCEVPLRENVPTNHQRLQLATSQKEYDDEKNSWQMKKVSLQCFAIMFCLLFLMNVYMLSRLCVLEKNILVSKGSWLPNELPTTKEEWHNLLEYQKSLHELELYKLKEIIGNTASLLEQVQLSIKSLHDDIERSIFDGRPKPDGKTLDKGLGKPKDRKSVSHDLNNVKDEL